MGEATLNSLDHWSEYRKNMARHRLAKKSVRSGFCLLWAGMISGSGYGMMWHAKKRVGVHRVAYMLAHGPIPAGWHVDHLCRNAQCVNPDHLEAVTPRENWARGRANSAPFHKETLA